MPKQDMEDKLQRFRTAVFKEVEASIAREDAEAKQQMQAEYGHYEAQLDSVYARMLTESKARLEQKYKREESRAQLAAGKTELLCRKQALDELEAAVKQRILAYLATESYRQQLIDTVKAFVKENAAPDLTILVRAEDVALLQAAVKKTAVQADKTNKLGGFAAMLPSKGICVNATIAPRLAAALNDAAKEI